MGLYTNMDISSEPPGTTVRRAFPKECEKVYESRYKGQIKHLFFTILVQTIPVVFSVFYKKSFKTLPNYDSNINLLMFPSWIILFMTYLKYFQINNQYEEMRVLPS